MKVLAWAHLTRMQPLAYVTIGAAALILLGSMVWIFSQSGPEAPLDTPVVAPLPMPTQSPARSMVESFVAVRDWSPASVAEFKRDWNSLKPSDREEALNAGWFERLTKAMSDELKTQKALSKVDKSGKARETGHRILALAEHLGVADHLPAFPGDAEPASVATGPMGAQVAAEQVSARTPPTAKVTGPSHSTSQGGTAQRGGTEKSPSTTLPAAAVSLPEPGAVWLASQADGLYTLQLFAVNGITKIAALRKQFAELDLKILDYPKQHPRYRVVYGTYPSAAAANAAHSGLPDSLRGTQQGYVTSIAKLKALGSASTKTTSVSARTPAPQQAPSGAYTLQVFASNSRDNVDKLVRSHPALALAVKDTASANAPRFRVIYGEYSSASLASAAAARLPQAILRITGAPIVKSLAALNAITRSP